MNTPDIPEHDKVSAEPDAPGSLNSHPTGQCVLCGEPVTGHGHNPEPLASYDDGRACDDCNDTRVIPARLMSMARAVPRPTWVMVIHERASDGDRSLTGQYLASYNPDAYDGHGAATWTEDVDQAMRFESPSEVLDFWRQTSKVKPIRADGRANRPLTAYTVEPRNLRA